jgi:hypothetical protein
MIVIVLVILVALILTNSEEAIFSTAVINYGNNKTKL